MVVEIIQITRSWNVFPCSLQKPSQWWKVLSRRCLVLSVLSATVSDSMLYNGRRPHCTFLVLDKGLPFSLTHTYSMAGLRSIRIWCNKQKIFQYKGYNIFLLKKAQEFWGSNLNYNCSKKRCTGKMAPPDENFVNAHSQHRQNFSSGPGTSNFWTVVVPQSVHQIWQ